MSSWRSQSREACSRTLGLLGLVVALNAGCQHEAEPLRNERAYEVRNGTVVMQQAVAIPFETAAVVEGPPLCAPAIPAHVSTIEALTAPAFAPLGGRVIESLVRLGDRVKRGARLVEVRSSELPLLHQEIDSSGAAVRAKESEIARLVRMVEARVGSEHDVMIARADLERLQIAERAARSRLASLTVAQAEDSASYFVLAPRDGTVVQIDALAGQVVGPERTSPLVTVASIEEVFVIGDVPARQAVDLKPGDMARVRLGQGDQTELEGRIEFVAEVVDPERQTIPVRVHVQNDQRLLRPNAFVELTFNPADQKGMLRVPTQAVVTDGPQSVVFVEVGPGRYQRRTVKVGRQTGEWSEVRAGIERGERVVVSHALLLLNAVEAES